jgi:hypothetical protein
VTATPLRWQNRGIQPESSDGYLTEAEMDVYEDLAEDMATAGLFDESGS